MCVFLHATRDCDACMECLTAASVEYEYIYDYILFAVLFREIILEAIFKYVLALLNVYTIFMFALY